MIWIILKSYGRIACTVFFMISAWYLSQLQFSLSRILKVWVTALFYTIIIYFMALALEIDIPPDYSIAKAIFPVLSTQLWFISVYIYLLFLSPFLNKGIENLKKRELEILIFIPLLSMLVYSTIMIDDGGMIKDVTFFPIVYLFMGYLRKYEFSYAILRHTVLWFILMLVSYGIICVLQYNGFWGAFENGTGIGDYYRSRFWTIPNFMCAISSFLFFKNINFCDLTFVKILASPTLGIYLIHQNPILVNIIWQWCDRIVSRFANLGIIIVLIVIVLVYLVTGAIERIRVVSENKIIIFIENR